ncbi:uncharacterized protein LOC116146683 isoform X1 [Pistacia vera]|uniref:uncharacterized protein LOC116146683 isoform X1 n=1 Tax=Pistacia vera TaxID=55513 RepID=UPI001263AF01|nr:uncharacterized protein LOC116146683 isoform X1 [Pistacia vera]
MRDEEQQLETAEELMQQLRSKATELLLREEWEQSVQVYSHFINLCQQQIVKATHDSAQLSKLNKSLCLAFSNRAEARSRLRDFNEALVDCEEALKIETTHFKALLCKGKILLSLNRYSMALDCFRATLMEAHASGNLESVNGFLEKCKKLEYQSRTGAFDLSNWILNGFHGKSPELAEYIGPVRIKKSEISGRGLFVTKNIDAGTLVLVTKAIATERGILSDEDSSEKVQLVMWKNFIDKVKERISKSQRTHHLISTLSSGENEDELDVPDTCLFKPETEESSHSTQEIDMGRILSILDVNSLVENAVSAKVLGKNRGLYGVGLWILASFINHSCSGNARRTHVGDNIIVHVSRDVKAGEEITFAYFDTLVPLEKRKEMSQSWGFNCCCKRCKFEEGMSSKSKQELREIEMGVERGMDVGSAVYRMEENVKRWIVRGKEKGYLRASFWKAYSETYGTERLMKRWGRRIPAVEVAVDSVAETVGSDERLLKVLKTNGSGMVEMERATKLAKGVYGKLVKKQALRSLLEMDIC